MLLGHECHPERYREQTSSLLAQCLQRLLPLAIGKHSLLRLLLRHAIGPLKFALQKPLPWHNR
jgi:hypothetical protein